MNACQSRLAAALLLCTGYVSCVDAQVIIDDITFVEETVSIGFPRGGLGVVDYNNDGFPDLVIGDNEGFEQILLENVEDPGTPGRRIFQPAPDGNGIDDTLGRNSKGVGVLAGDYDNDGNTDVFILGERRSDGTSGLLYRNNGDGTFTNLSTPSGVRNNEDDTPESGSFVDYDLDGDLDILIAATSSSTNRLRLLENDGDGTFSNANTKLPPVSWGGTVYSHTWTDLENDGWPDCVIIGSGSPAVLRNVPDGAAGRRFDEVASDVGFATIGPAPMGIASADWDDDGDLDLSVSNGDNGAYFRNDNGLLTSIDLIDSIWGWGILWFDADNDGLADNFQSGSAGSSRNNNKLFRRTTTGFDDVSGALNDSFASSQYAVMLDVENDGRMDIVVLNPFSTGFVALNRNQSVTSNHWVTLDLVGDGSRINTNGIGARVALSAGGATQHAHLASGSSTSSTNDLRLHFGLGDATVIDTVEVVWPTRAGLRYRTDTYAGLPIDQVVEITPRCPADLNEDGSTSVEDLLLFLADWFQDDADFDGDDQTGITDLLNFLADWFPANAGSDCP